MPGRPRRAAWIAAAALLAAAVAAFLWLARSLDARVERALERIGSELLGTDVSIASVDVDLRAGRAAVHGLEVANPRGEQLAFSDEPAIRSDRVDVTLDLASLAGSPIVLSEVRVRAPRLSAEVTPAAVNLIELERRVSRASPAEVEERAGDPAEARRFAIRRFVLEGANVRADSRAVGGDLRELALADVELRDVGGARGATAAEIGQTVLEALLTRTLAQLAREQIGEYLEEQLEELKDRAADALRDLLSPRRRAPPPERF